MPIFLPRKFKFAHAQHNHRGFTLIEVMIVLVLMAAIITLGAPKLANRGREMKAEVRRIALLMKDLHQRAQLKHMTYRLGFDLGAGAEKSYWVESATGDVKLLNDEQKKELDRYKKRDDKTNPSDQGFSPDAGVLKEPKKLKHELFIKSVEYAGRNTVTTEGNTFVYFFPQGLSEEVAVQISNPTDNAHWTLILHPITGQVTIYSKEARLKDLRK